ncbi:Pleckstrin like domain containing family G member 3 [Dissostichus eleginoides]|uniref:Pleckstrin like domain containing family G member 3 n=1 Tax=Dissostichus eleginoides TaxID=100907 RepID=A0AAD9FCV0_DISEL|nr:Pleckstrin like domain containing family G member 3 [Dissostichus eleginoides]
MCENDPVAIARCFVDKSEHFEIYTQYCTNYPNSVAALTDCMGSKTLAKFFRERQADLRRSLPLGSYLLKPVQRILKYHLLLQEIARHFDPEEEGHEVIQEAIDTMTGVAWYINDMKRKHEHAVRVQEIQSLLINWKGPDLTTYGELKRGEHYVYKIHISCATLMLLDSAKDPLLFSVIHFKHPKQPHTVQAKSVEEKRLWAHHIKRLILENHNTIIPQKAKEAILDNSNYPGKYHYSPERLKKTESCNSDDFHDAGRNGRRRSEPAKQIMWTTKAVLKHADSEGALLGERCSLQPDTSVSALASSVGEERSCVESLIPRRHSLEPLSPTNSDLKLVADFASSVLAAISCWHYRARALLSTHFTTDDQNKDTAELKTTRTEEVETHSQEEQHVDVAAKETPATQANVEELCPPYRVPQVKKMDETSVLTNGELSEEEEEGLSDDKSILPSSVLDQASVIAERFIGSLSRRSSLVSEDLGSLACPSPSVENEVFKSPSACMDLEQHARMLAQSSPERQVTSEADLSTPTNDPELHALIEGELGSTLSKQDRLLIRKIRKYYEHAEHQDANFSIKRRESLSYIPAGLVQHLSRQLNSVPQEEGTPVSRKGLSRNRPTSWSVFDLPGLDKNRSAGTPQKTEPQRAVGAKARSQSISEASTSTEEEFRPSSEMHKVWQEMEMAEENEHVLQSAEETLNVLSLDVTQDTSADLSDVKTNRQPSLILEESEISSASDLSPISSPTTTFPALEGGSSQDSTSQDKSHADQAQLPRITSLRASLDEDQILQDMGKMKNKVFQLARQYSQRIKNNRPLVWQRNREKANQQAFKSLPAVQEEKVQLRKKGNPNLRLPLNICDQAVIHEERSPSPEKTPSSAASPQSPPPETEAFHWPHVQELRTKYTDPSHSSRVTRSCTAPNGLLECSTERCNGCSHKYSSSSDLHSALTDSPSPQSESGNKESCAVEDWAQPLLCRWSSLDHMLGSLPLNEVQNLKDPVRTCLSVSQVSLTKRETGKDGDSVLHEELDCTNKSAAPGSGKITESNLVKSLREKFHSLTTSS